MDRPEGGSAPAPVRGSAFAGHADQGLGLSRAALAMRWKAFERRASDTEVHVAFTDSAPPLARRLW